MKESLKSFAFVKSGDFSGTNDRDHSSQPEVTAQAVAYLYAEAPRANVVANLTELRNDLIAVRKL